MKNSIMIRLFALLGTFLSSCAQTTTKQEQITPKELNSWQTYGKGKSSVIDDVLTVEETEGSDGYFIISPELIAEDFVLTYKVKALSESTVLINLFSVAQTGNDDTFTLPPLTAYSPRSLAMAYANEALQPYF